MSKFDSDADDSGMDVLYGRDGLRAGVDNRVDLLVCITAPNMLSDGTRGTIFEVGDGPMATAEEYERALAHAATLAFRNVRLMLSLVPGVSVEPIGATQLSDRTWGIPDIAWCAEILVPMRMLVPSAVVPSAGEGIRLARIKFQADFVSDEASQVQMSHIQLPVLTDEEFQNLPLNEFVLDRVREAG